MRFGTGRINHIVPSAFLALTEWRPVYRQHAGGAQTLDASGDYRPIAHRNGVLRLADVRRGTPLCTGQLSMLWDLGDEVWCLEFTGPVPALNQELLGEIRLALDEAIAANQTLVFFNEGPVFAAGADMKQVLAIVDQPGAVERFISTGQRLFADLQHAPVPVVGALTGSALAGGFELFLHCHTIQAHAESAMGLVEAQVGIVPGWDGCREMLARSAAKVGVEQAIAHCFDLLRSGTVSASALEARELGFLGEGDDITMNRDRVLFDAKQKAIALRGAAPAPVGPPALVAPEDVVMSGKGYQRELEQALLELLCRSNESDWYEHFLDYERATDVRLFGRSEVRARIRHLMETGKLLLN